MDVLPGNDNEEKRVHDFSPVYDHLASSTSSSTNCVYCYNPNVPYKKRFLLIEDEDSEKNLERICFDTSEDEENHYTQKVDELFEEMRNKFSIELATKTATKICPPLHNENKEKKKKIKPEPVVIDRAVTERLERFIKSDEINGSDMKLVIEKELFKSDLRPGQNRLNMPMKQLQNPEFLWANEKPIVNTKEGMAVGLVGPDLQIYKEPMMLKKWRMERTENYVFKKNWNKFREDYKDYLKAGRIIQVWSFRINQDQQLRLALVVVG